MHVSRHVGRRRLFSHSIAVGGGTTDFNDPVSRNVAIDTQMQNHGGIGHQNENQLRGLVVFGVAVVVFPNV